MGGMCVALQLGVLSCSRSEVGTGGALGIHGESNISHRSPNSSTKTKGPEQSRPLFELSSPDLHKILGLLPPVANPSLHQHSTRWEAQTHSPLLPTMKFPNTTRPNRVLTPCADDLSEQAA